MGWASDALWRRLGVLPTVSTVNQKTYEEDNMSGLRNIPQNAGRNDLVRVCDNRHILGETDKAIKVRIGQTLYGEPHHNFLSEVHGADSV